MRLSKQQVTCKTQKKYLFSILALNEQTNKEQCLFRVVTLNEQTNKEQNFDIFTT